MRKLIILTLALVMALGTMAFATNTRVLTMGNNNNIMLDDANIWLYPSRINQYPNLAIAEAESDGYGMYQVGVHWKFGEQKPWVLGTYISTGMDVYPSSYPTDRIGYYNFGYGYYDYYPETDVSIQNSDWTNRRIDLIYGRKLGTTLFGFGFDYVHNSDSWEQDTLNPKLSFTQYTFAFGLTPEKGNWDVTLGFSTGTWTDQDEYGTDVTKPDGYYDLYLAGRYFYQYNPTINFVPHLAFAIGKHGQKVDSTYAPPVYAVKSSQTAMDIGCGMHYMPTTNVLAVLDFGVLYRKVKNEDRLWRGYSDPNDNYPDAEEKIMDLPYWKIGVEGEVFNWMDIRFGAISEWQAFTAEWKEEEVYTEKWNWGLNTTFLGFGLNFNRLHIDTYTDPEILLDGFNFISGSEDAEDLNFHVSVLYEMF